MIRKVFQIMLKDYTTVDAFWGIRRVRDIAEETCLDCFPVLNNGKTVGVLTADDLIKSHPNRIVLDAMSGGYNYIDANKSVWEARELFENPDTDVLFAVGDEGICGIVTKSIIELEINKHIDPLTGLYTRDYIIHKAQRLLEQGNEISIIFFDINDFGHIDKEFGHIVGDNILKEFARVLKDLIPADAFLCRYGGDEFILLTTRYAKECQSIAKEIMSGMEQYKFVHGIGISVSVGVAGGRRRKPRGGDAGRTVMDLINTASLASTKAKDTVGNLVLASTNM